MQKVFIVEKTISWSNLEDLNDELRRYRDAKVVSVTPFFQQVSAGSSMHQEGNYGVIIVIDYNEQEVGKLC